MAWGILCLRAAQHYLAGLDAEKDGQTAEAVREMESAVACCAPLNPYCGLAAERMLELSRLAISMDPAFSEEIRDRLLRSLHSTRWLFQPHANLLATARSYGPNRPPKEPNGWIFLLSWIALLAGMGAWWWIPRSLEYRVVWGVGGLVVWGALLYLC